MNYFVDAPLPTSKPFLKSNIVSATHKITSSVVKHFFLLLILIIQIQGAFFFFVVPAQEMV